MTLPDYQSVCQAAHQIAGYAYRTAVIESPALNRYLGTNIYFKCEHMQVIGAFKFRGAFNAISKLSEQQLQQGVLTYSSGNHGQAVAMAAKILQANATIVMPNNAPKAKLAGVNKLDAKVVLYDPFTENREQVAAELDPDGNMALIPPYNHIDVISGQGTSALELLTDYPNIEQLLTPCGGGGLLSGSALAASGMNPHCEVYGVEPEIADDAKQSLAKGEIISIDYPDTIADGVRTLALGKLTFAVIKKEVTDIVTVSEDAIKTATSILVSHMKQLVEPSAVLGLAALLEGSVRPKSHVGIILSGGNADMESLISLIKSHPSVI